MPPSQQVLDSLWQCLCPSFSRTGLAIRPHVPQSPFRIRGLPRGRPHIQSRATSTAPIVESSVSSDVPTLDEILAWDVVKAYPRAPELGSREFNFSSRARIRRRLRQYGQNDVEALYRLLAQAANESDPLAVENYVQFLIRHRNQRPNSRMYAALLMACAHHETGSVVEIERLLKEAELNEIPFDGPLYEAALKALSVHPSYTLRTALLEQMKSKWILLSNDGWHYLCCAQIREKQIEMALETLHTMKFDYNIEPREWLLDVFSHVLSDIGEFEILTDLMGQRLAHGRRPHNVLWLHMLSKAAENLHHPIVSNCWNAVCRPGHVNPPTGLCTLILNTAARAGDEVLAADVFRVLGNRSSPIQMHHYEALLDATLRAGVVESVVELRKVFTYYCIMERSSPGAVTLGTTRSLFEYLKQGLASHEHVISDLREVRARHGTIPIAALDVIIEAAIASGKFDLALDFYKDLHQFTKTGAHNPAQISTFNTLLTGCCSGKHKSTAMFLAAEMVALRIQPDVWTYDRLILSCLNGNAKDSKWDKDLQLRHINDAFRYFQEMAAQSWIPGEQTLLRLAQALAQLEDDRYNDVFEILERQEIDTIELKSYAAALKKSPWPWAEQQQQQDSSIKEMEVNV